MLKDPVPLAEVRRVLVVKLRHLGDVLLSAPVLGALKSNVPEAEIDALVYADTAEMLSLHPALCQLHVIDRDWKRQGPVAQAAAEWRLLAALRARRYDLVVHLTEHPRGAWLARACGARWAVGPRVPGRGGWWNGAFSHFYAEPRFGHRHAVERNLDALRRIGIQPTPAERRLDLVADPATHARVAELMREHGLTSGAFLHIHPASRWRFKCWPTSRFVRLIDELAEAGWRVVLSGAPSGAEREMLERIKGDCRGEPVDLGGKLSLKEMAALCAQARLFVGVDSAPMHIASAVGTPVVALFGPSGEDDWGPWQVPARVVVSQDHPCRPCGLDGCGGGKVSDCLEQLEVDRVLAAVREMLAAD